MDEDKKCDTCGNGDCTGCGTDDKTSEDTTEDTPTTEEAGDTESSV